MTERRPICVECLVEMTCFKNDIEASFNDVAFYSGDVYKCKECGKKVLVGFGDRYDSSRLFTDDEQLKIKED